MTRVHLVYPHRPITSAPDVIGHQLAAHLTGRYEVVVHDWDVNRIIEPRDGDVLVGHAHPAPWTVFRRSVRRPGWARRVLLQPYHHGDTIQMAWADPVVRQCDLFLAITGPFWFGGISRSPFAHWKRKMVHVDLAVDRNDFPNVNESFNEAGDRRFLYIGNTHWGKNTEYISALVRRTGIRVTWIGRGRPIEGVDSLGPMDLSTEAARKIVASHDFLLTVGRADANPTTILEAMAWGLIPVCTRQSGYTEAEGVVNVPLDDLEGASRVLTVLQQRAETELLVLQSKNHHALDSHYTWDRFGDQVIAAIESGEAPKLDGVSKAHTARLAAIALRSPHSALHPRQLEKLLKH